jgi:hypothetical protein
VASPLPYIPGEPQAITGTSYIFNAPNNSLAMCNPYVTVAASWPTTLMEWLGASNSFVGIFIQALAKNLNNNDAYSSGKLSFLIGSNATKNCVSRFGIQDALGFGVVFSDTFIRTNGTTVPATIQATSSVYDPGNLDNGNFSFNGILGPLAKTNNGSGVYYALINTTSTTTPCSTATTTVSSLIPALGLPVCTWSGGVQNLRSMSEFELTGQIGSTPVTGGGGVAGVHVPWDAAPTMYNMTSGEVGRFGMGFVPSTTYKYTNVFCGIEAE